MNARISLPNFGDGTRTQALPFPSDLLSIDTETTGLKVWSGHRAFAIVICDMRGRSLYVSLARSDSLSIEEDDYQGNLLIDQISLDRRAPDFPGEGQGQAQQAVRAADWLLLGDLPCESGPWTLHKVGELLAGPRPKVFHNCKFDIRMLYWTFGWEMGGEIHDTMLLARLMIPSAKRLGLKILGDEVLMLPAHEEAEVSAWLKLNKKSFIATYGREPCYMDVPHKIMSKYAVGDVHRTMLLLRRWWISMHDKRKEVYDYEIELCFETMAMEDVGMRLDLPYTKKMYLETARRVSKLDQEIHEIMGVEFNINSHKQMARYFLTPDGLDLKSKLPEKKFKEYRRVLLTKAGNLSTDRDSLKIYREYDETEACDKAILRGMLVGMAQNYKKFMEEHYVNSKGQAIVRPSILQHTAVTGRFSIVEPPLQTIPSRSSGRLLDFERDEIPDVRRAFTPTYPSWPMFAWDYSQVELRLIAFYAQEEAMIKAFMDGKDIHDMTTHTIWDTQKGFDLKDPIVWKRCRTFSKMVNFGIPYGMQEEKFHQELDTPMDIVREVMRTYNGNFPGMANLMDEIKRKIRMDGYLHSIFGRLLLPERSKAYKGTNYLIQGTAADIMKRAIVHVRRFANANYIRMIQILTIHDEIINQIHPDDCTPEVMLATKAVLEDFPEFQPLPITVGCKQILTHWSDTKEYDFETTPKAA